MLGEPDDQTFELQLELNHQTFELQLELNQTFELQLELNQTFELQLELTQVLVSSHQAAAHAEARGGRGASRAPAAQGTYRPLEQAPPQALRRRLSSSTKPATSRPDATLPATSRPDDTLPATSRPDDSFVEGATLLAPAGAVTDEDSRDEAPMSLGGEGLTEEHRGRYRTDRELGQGGIGKVLLVFDRHLGREVALKELLPSGVEGSGAATPASGRSTRRSPAELRFVNEARVTGQLEHPGVVPVYELGRRADGTIYYAMKLVRGRTFGQALEGRDLRGRLELLPHFVDLCHAVAYAHSRGVVHRDIKPENVMLGDFGETVVLDWGLAKVKGQKDLLSGKLAQQADRLQHASAVSTVVGVPIGTPSYMPPEQALGEVDEIDERSDVYSLGAVLYELLTGSPPFSGKTAFEVVRNVLGQELVAPSSLEPECPPELAAIAVRALHKERDGRYADAAALAKDVRAFLTGGLVGAHRYSLAALLRRRLRRHRRLLLGAVLAFAAATGAWLYRGYDLARHAQAWREARAEQARVLAVGQAERILAEVAHGSTEPRWFDRYTFRLVMLSDPATREALEDRLVAALGDGSNDVRRLAAASLGGMKSARAVDALCARLADQAEPSEDVRIEIINALGIIGDARAEVPVHEARERAGQRSRLWDQTALAYRLIPSPPVPAEGLSPERWTERGRALGHKGETESALEAFGRAIDADPKLGRAYNDRAVLRETLGDYRGALGDYDRAHELSPDEPAILINRAVVHRVLEDYEGALADYDRVLASGKVPIVALRNRAAVRRYQGDFEGSLRDLGQALERAPIDPRTLVLFGVTYAAMEHWPEAGRAFDRTLESNRDYVDGLVGRALARYALGEPSAALADLGRAIELDPDLGESRWLRAYLRLQQGDAPGAKADLDHCLEPRCEQGAKLEPMRRAARAVIYHAGLGDFAQAEAELGQAIARSRNPVERVELASYGLAVALRLGAPAAIEDWRARLDPTGVPPWEQGLVELLRGSKTHDELGRRAFVPARRCQLELAAGVRAELAGDSAAARERYRAGAGLPWVNVLACVLARTSSDDVSAELGAQ